MWEKWFNNHNSDAVLFVGSGATAMKSKRSAENNKKMKRRVKR